MPQPPSLTISRGYGPGAIGRIAELHAVSYARLAGFGLAFESLVAREVAAFCETLEARGDGLWLARQDGRIEGCIAIQRADEARAHLRWFLVSEALRGRGTGRALLGEALAFCRAGAIRRLDLWTFAGLDAARWLYEEAGFRLVEQQSGARWGATVTEQRFELRLGPGTP
ncbi:GNAT family N-acetyltransferase [Falsiroseomonas oryzae]|uniref:GNAT family N-acetyltransferase n=1 Tax=Falsiroseomonas oryzae TaxID=2766473 RepID=UPI0022EB981D|nr:GNAT family N-acetyltransferase [Roseomonas sp. MO-31]